MSTKVRYVAALAAGAAVLGAPAPGNAASSGSTIKACANKKTGALRLVVGKNRRCGKRERRVSLGAVGPSGAQGPQGAAGAQGAVGPQGSVGPQGPGASSFTQVTAQDSALHDLANTGDLKVSGFCSPGSVQLTVAGVGGVNPLDASGIGTNGPTTITSYQYAGFSSVFISDANSVSFDLLLRHEVTGKLYWLKAFGQRRATDCRFWGVVIPGT
jgi:hypothetical protein